MRNRMSYSKLRRTLRAACDQVCDRHEPLVIERLRSGLGWQTVVVCNLGEPRHDLVLDVAGLLRADLGMRDGVAGLLEASLNLDLLARTCAELRGRLLPHGLVGRQLRGQRVTPHRHGLGCLLQRGRSALGP